MWHGWRTVTTSAQPLLGQQAFFHVQGKSGLCKAQAWLSLLIAPAKSKYTKTVREIRQEEKNR